MATFDTTLPSTMVMDEGFITVNGSTPYAVLGGPITVDFGQQWQNMEYAGKRAPTGLLDRCVYTDCKISGTAIALASANTPVWITGSTQAGSDPLTVTPHAMSTFLAAGDYETSVRGVFKRSDGKYVTVTMAKALVKLTGIQGADKDKVSMPIEITAVQDLSSSTDTDVVPFTVTITTSL